MSEAKHTKGPWRLEADPCHFDSLTTVTGGQRMNAKPHAWPAYPLTVQVGGTATLMEQQANARLIAAAPELLAALQEVTMVLDRIFGVEGREPDAESISGRARAAIAKATNQ